MACGRLIECLLVACICYAPAESFRSGGLDASELYAPVIPSHDSCAECEPVLDRFKFAVQQCSTDAYQPGPYIILNTVDATAQPSLTSTKLSSVKRGTEVEITRVTRVGTNVWGVIDTAGASQPGQGSQQEAWILLTHGADGNNAAMFPPIGWYRILGALRVTEDPEGKETIAQLQRGIRVQVTGQPIMDVHGKVRAPIGPYRAHRGVLVAGMPRGYITLLDAGEGKWHALPEFESHRNGSPWLNVLARHGTPQLVTDLASEMEHRLWSPEFTISQAGYGFCAMATVIFMQALTYPVQYGEMMQNLFCTGAWTNTMGYSVKSGMSMMDYVRKAVTLGGNTSDMYQADVTASMASLDWIAMTSLGNNGDPITGIVQLESPAHNGGKQDFQIWRFAASLFGDRALTWVLADYYQGYKTLLNPHPPSPASWAPVVAAAAEPSKMILISMFVGPIAAVNQALTQWRFSNHMVVLLKSYPYRREDSTEGHVCLIWTWSKIYWLDCDVLRKLSRQGTQIDIAFTEIAPPPQEAPVGAARAGSEELVEFSTNAVRLALFKQQLDGKTVPMFPWAVTGLEDI